MLCLLKFAAKLVESYKMSHLGDVYTSNGKFFAKIEAREGGIRFHMEGPRRECKQQATLDRHSHSGKRRNDQAWGTPCDESGH